MCYVLCSLRESVNQLSLITFMCCWVAKEMWYRCPTCILLRSMCVRIKYNVTMFLSNQQKITNNLLRASLNKWTSNTKTWHSKILEVWTVGRNMSIFFSFSPGESLILFLTEFCGMSSFVFWLMRFQSFLAIFVSHLRH